MKRAYVRNSWRGKELVCVNAKGDFFIVKSEGPKWKLWVQWMLAQTESQLLGAL